MRVFCVCVSTLWIITAFVVVWNSACVFTRGLRWIDTLVMVMTLVVYAISSINWVSHLFIVLISMEARVYLRRTVTGSICCVWHIIKWLPIRSQVLDFSNSFGCSSHLYQIV